MLQFDLFVLVYEFINLFARCNITLHSVFMFSIVLTQQSFLAT